MKSRVLALIFCTLTKLVSGEDHWAVLVAGSNDFSNYRHQADVCHAYHVLTARGFHPEKIITMMYDDVANSKENPIRGKLFNQPWKDMSQAVDVYAGCKIDYRAKDVNPDKFVAVLTGDADKAGGRVLQSKADDHVFINFVDHGAVGLIAFPDGVQPPVMHAKQLISTLKAMHSKGMYKQLTFYLETCESGSMFEGLLPKSLPVYAVTAANAKESSWGTYCGGQAKVGGKNINACLGDLFSVKWMQDSDKTKGTNETMKQQFARVQTRTKKSHVMRYGQLKHIGSEQVSDFQNAENSSAAEVFRGEVDEDIELADMSAVDSRDIKLDYLYHAYLRKGTAEAGERLAEEIKARKDMKELAAALQASMPHGAEPERQDGETFWTEERLACHERATSTFGAACGWTERRLPLSRHLYELCVRASHRGEVVEAAVRQTCGAAAPAAEVAPEAEVVV